MAVITTYNATDLTGGVARSLNSISESVLIDGDRCHVAYSGDFYVYEYDATATDAQNSPAIVRPADYVSSGVWKSQGLLLTVETVTGAAVDNSDTKNPIIVGGSITEIKTGSWGNGVAVDWLGTGLTISEFDAIITTGAAQGIYEGKILPSAIFLAVASVHIAAYGTVNNVSAASITDTSLSVVSTGAGTMTGLYGIQYTK